MAEPRERALELPGLEGALFGEVAPELVERLPAWARRELADARPLKAPDVHRVGDLVLKYFAPPRGWARLRTAFPALRTARRHAELLPVPTPRPVAAVRAAGRGESLLVSAFVEGPLLGEAWARDPAARAALPGFLASMRRARVLHGDLHPANLVFDGQGFTLLDVDGVRHRRHRLARVEASWWALLRIHLGDDEGLRAAHRAYARLFDEDPAPGWARVEARTDVLLARRTRPVPPGGLGTA